MKTSYLGLRASMRIAEKKNFSIEKRDVFLQGAKYIIKHLPEEWKRTVVTTKKRNNETSRIIQ